MLVQGHSQRGTCDSCDSKVQTHLFPEATHMSIDGRVEKQTVVQPDHGLFPSLEQEGSADTCYGAGDPKGRDAKGHQPVTRRHTRCDSSYARSLKRSPSHRQTAAWRPGPGAGRRELCFVGTERGLEREGGGGRTHVGAHKPLNCGLKNGWHGRFYVACVFPHHQQRRNK